jgi:hypothetical protein
MKRAVFILACAVALLSVSAAFAQPKKLTCCQQALEEKRDCKNKCCIAAHKEGKSCTKCNPNKEDAALLKKLEEWKKKK